jgi:hypothetical protein
MTDQYDIERFRTFHETKWDMWIRMAEQMTIRSLELQCEYMAQEARELDPIDIQLGTDKAGQMRDQIWSYRKIVAQRKAATRRTVTMNLTPMEADIIKSRRQG